MWKQSVVASVVREKSSELNVSPGERFYIAHLVFQSTSRADDDRRALHRKWDSCCFGPRLEATVDVVSMQSLHLWT